MEQKIYTAIDEAARAFEGMADNDLVMTPEGMRDLAMDLRQIVTDDMDTSEPDEYVLKEMIMQPKPDNYGMHGVSTAIIPQDARDIQLIIEREHGPTGPVKEYKMVWLEKVRRE